MTSNFIAVYIQKKIENICSHKDLDTYVHSIVLQKIWEKSNAHKVVKVNTKYSLAVT